MTLRSGSISSASSVGCGASVSSFGDSSVCPACDVPCASGLDSCCKDSSSLATPLPSPASSRRCSADGSPPDGAGGGASRTLLRYKSAEFVMFEWKCHDCPYGDMEHDW